MKQGWKIKKLGELCTIQLGKTPYRKNSKFWDKEKTSGNIWLSIADLKHGQQIFESEEQITDLGVKKVVKIPKGTMMLSFKLTLGRVSFAGCDLYTNEAIASLLNLKNEISKEFLFYYFTLFDWDKSVEGDVKVKGKTLNKKKLNELEIVVPPLEEQQHIVSILDKCFAAIDKAKANAEQNLKNAKELFESVLNEKLTVDNGQREKKRLQDVALTFGRGKSKHRPRNWEGLYGGEYPFIQTGEVRNANKYVTEYNKTYNEVGLAQSKIWKKGTICITIAANIAETAILGFDACIPDSIIGFQVDEKKANLDFTYYLLQYFKAELQKLGKGSAQDNINLGTFENQLFPFPPLSTQRSIVRQLDALRAETQRLEAVYQKKMTDLEELKKSILQKAFAGELTTSISTSVPLTKIIPLQRIEGISTTDLQAGITAFALQKHIEQNQQHSFHHVKAEKIVHLSEYILNIDLERNPVKDAAGPNDFTHAKKVESRARKAGFYSVFKNGDYYDYQQGKNIDSVVQKAQNSLGEKAVTLSQIINMLIPMTTQQAEIIATVFGAWNNLILSGNQITEEVIVTEARENWHKEKLKIPRDKFFKALEWMKQREVLIPKGNGKIVKVK